jgi:ATP-dependent protease ClpP protease subunit
MDLDKLVALAESAKTTTRAQRRSERGTWFRFENKTAASAELFLYDEIGGYGVTAADMVAELGQVSASEITLRINSGGGSVFEGTAIYAALKRHPARVNGYVDGIAASAASFIAMACDRLTMEKPAKLMIHDAAAGGMYIEGNAELFRAARVEVVKMADLLDDLSDTIAEIYADRAGGTVAEWRARMRAETWYGAAEAVAAGLADEVNGVAAPKNEAIVPVFDWNPGNALRAVMEAVQ